MEEGDPVGVLRAGAVGGEEKQVLPGKHLGRAVGPAQGQQDIQGIPLLLHLNVGHVSAEDGGNLPAVPAGDDLPHRPAAGEQAVQIAVQKGLDALLVPPGGHRPQELVQFPLCSFVLTGNLHPAGEADQLQNGRIHHGNGLPDGPVEAELRLVEGDVPVHEPEGVAVGLAQLDHRRPHLLPPVSFE